MTLHHLEVLVAVCQEKTMHAAAQKLNISQPAISKMIADLEQYYHVKLFERINHRLYLTPVGETMRSYAVQILEMFQNMENEIHEQGRQDHIRIGASVSVGTCLLPPLLQQLKQTMPQTTYAVTVHNTSRIEQMVNDYTLDLGLVEGKIENANLVIEKIGEDELVLVAAAKHPLVEKQNLTYRDLEEYPFISRENGSSSRNQLELHLQELGLNLRMNYSCSSVEAIKQALLYTDGIAVLSKMMVQEEIKKGALAVLPLDEMKFKRSIRLIYHKNKYLSPAMQTLLQLLQD